MKEFQKQLLEALRAFLNEEKAEVFLSEETEWSALYQLASAQTVLPMIYEAFYRTSEMLPPALSGAGKREIRMSAVRQILKTDALLRVYRALLERGLKVLVVKGVICRSTYPQPDLRASGDEDLYVEEAQFGLAHEVMLEQGLLLNEGDDPERSEVVTYFEPASGLHIELHRRLFSEDSEAYSHLNQAFDQVFEHGIQVEIQGVPVWTMSQTEHLLYLVCHGFKHFLHSGFGVRQVCDVVMFARKYGAEVDWDWLMTQAQGFHADVFMMNLFEIGERYLGISLTEAHVPEKQQEAYRSWMDCEMLLEDLLDAGVYGGSSLDRKRSSLITLNAVASEGKKSGGTYALKTLLPGVKELKRRFTYLEKQPYLLPVAWVQRIWGYMRGSDHDVKESIEIGNHRVELLKKYHVIR